MEKELRKLRRDLVEIERDCLKLKKKGDLTEYGRGELHIIGIVRELNKIITDEVWSVLNVFRMKNFFEEKSVEIDVGEFDGVIEGVKRVLVIE